MARISRWHQPARSSAQRGPCRGRTAALGGGIRSARGIAGALVAALAITYGCSADDVASVLNSNAPAQAANANAPAAVAGGQPVVADAGQGASIVSPLALNASAQFGGRGKEDDLVSANRTADALFGALGGGALEAADADGGAIDDPDLAIGSAFGGQSQGAWLLPASIATLASDIGATEIRPEGGAVWVRSVGGLEAKVTGVSALTSPNTTGMPDLVVGYRVASAVRLLGTLGFGSRPDLDLRITGLSGMVGRNGDGSHAIDLVASATGVGIQGLVAGFRVDATLSGVYGRFTDLAKLNKQLFSSPLNLYLNQVSAREVVTSLRGQAVLHSMKLPEREGQWARFSMSGNLDATLDKRHPFARTGRVARVSAAIAKATALAFDGLTGPIDGAVTLELINAAGTVKDKLTQTYKGGALFVSGQRTNVTGEQERVTTSDDTRRAQGNVRWADGSRSEHVVEVRRTERGRRITVRYIVKDPRGVQVVAGDGVVHAGRSLSGKWVRPAPGASSGTWKLLSDGELELYGPDGDLIVRAQLRDGWSELLY